MAQENTKKPKKTKDEKRKLDISMKAVIDNMVFTKSDGWAYYKLANRGYEFLDFDGQAALVRKLQNALSSLLQDREVELELHLIVTSVPVDIPLWRDQVETLSEDWNRSAGFNKYMNQLEDFLLDMEYHNKTVFLGVHLGKRGALDLPGLSILESGWTAAVDVAKQWSKKALSIPTEDIDEEEEQTYRKKEVEIYRTLHNGILAATRATSEDLLLLVKRQMYPAMPAPYLDVDHGSRLGSGDLALETASVIENNYRWLRMVQMVNGYEMEGYRACLSMSAFPKEMVYPGNVPFFFFVQKLRFPFTTWARLTLIPSKEMKKTLEKKKKEQADEVENVQAGMTGTKSAVQGGAPHHVQEGLATQQQIDAILQSDKSAWVRGSYFVEVFAPSEEYLRTHIDSLKKAFKDQEINVSWTAGDQAALFLSQMPGDKVRMKSFDQITQLSMIPASGFNFSSEVGDPLIGQNNIE